MTFWDHSFGLHFIKLHFVKIMEPQAELKLKLKKIGRQIAKFPEEMFGSNAISSRRMRLSYYLDSRQKNISLREYISAERDLKRLQNDEKIVWGVFI